METLVVRCPFCSRRLRLKSRAAMDRRSRCPECGTSFVPRQHGADSAAAERNAASSIHAQLAQPGDTAMRAAPVRLGDDPVDRSLPSSSRYLQHVGPRQSPRKPKKQSNLVGAFLIGAATVVVGGSFLMALVILSRPDVPAPAKESGLAAAVSKPASRPASDPNLQADGRPPAEQVASRSAITRPETTRRSSQSLSKTRTPESTSPAIASRQPDSAPDLEERSADSTGADKAAKKKSAPVPAEVAALLAEMKSTAELEERAPSFRARGLDRKPLRLEEEAAGAKYVLLDFWASWCGPCRREYPHLKRLQKNYADKGLKIIGISLDSDRSAAIRAARSAGLDYRHAFDGKGWKNAVAKLYQVRAIPQTYLLDSDLNLVAEGMRGAQLEQVMPYLLQSDSEDGIQLVSTQGGDAQLPSGMADMASSMGEAFTAAVEEMTHTLAGEMANPLEEPGFVNEEMDFEAQGLDGETVRLSDEAAGTEYVLLDFWASWCGPCKGEFPHLRSLNRKYGGQGLKIIGVSLDDDPSDARQAARTANLDYLHVVDSDGTVANQYQVRAIPQTFLMDKNLNVIASGLRGRAMEERIERLLKGRGRTEVASSGSGLAIPRTRSSGARSPSEEEPKSLAVLLGDLRARLTRTRASAALALGRLRGEAAEAVPDLIEALKNDESYLVRSRAATALGNIALRTQESVPALIEALEDEDPTTRSAAARALRAIGPPAEDAIPALMAAMSDPNLSVQSSANDAIEAIRQ